MDSFKEALNNWNSKTGERSKLQQVYFIVALSLLVIAGLLSLLGSTSSVQLLYLSYGLAVVFFVNAISWALLQSFVLARLSSRSSTRASSRKK